MDHWGQAGMSVSSSRMQSIEETCSTDELQRKKLVLFLISSVLAPKLNSDVGTPDLVWL